MCIGMVRCYCSNSNIRKWEVSDCYLTTYVRKCSAVSSWPEQEIRFLKIDKDYRYLEVERNNTRLRVMAYARTILHKKKPVSTRPTSKWWVVTNDILNKLQHYSKQNNTCTCIHTLC